MTKRRGEVLGALALCVLLSGTDADAMIINIEGTHECPLNHEWDGWMCTKGDPVLGSGFDDVDFEDQGFDGPSGGGVLPPFGPKEPTDCEKCDGDAQTCANAVNATVAWQTKRMQNEARQKCIKPGDLYAVRARGDLKILRLLNGVDVIPGIPKERWWFDCTEKEVAPGETEHHCWGPFEQTCLDSYKMDLPAAQFGKDATVELTLGGGDFGGLSLGEQVSVSYSYGGATGWFTAANQLKSQLDGVCAMLQFKCKQHHQCGG